MPPRDSQSIGPIPADELQLLKEHRRGANRPLIEDSASVPLPEFLRQPATIQRLESKSEFIEAANEYFAYCEQAKLAPQLTDLALAFGLPGVSSLHRLGRRRPDLTEVLSRCITAIASGYEKLLASSASRGAIFALKHLPDFDLEEPVGSPEVAFWTDKQQLEVTSRIAGVKEADEEGSDLSPEEAYVKIMRGGVPFEVLEHAMAKREKEINPIELLESERADH